MPAREKPRAPDAPSLVWEREEPARRSAPEPLSRERIVRAAIALADADGLAAVSLRNVAAALDAGPMRLYGYLDTKEDLLELMVDVVYGEMAASGPIRKGWRKALQTVARRTRTAAKKHEWFAELLGARHHRGPNALAHLEASLAALGGASGFENIDDALIALGTVNAYVLGAIRVEASEVRSEIDSGMDKAQWQNASAPYLQKMIATGRFPTLERVMVEAKHPSQGVRFDRGLELVLDGIASKLRGEG